MLINQACANLLRSSGRDLLGSLSTGLRPFDQEDQPFGFLSESSQNLTSRA